MESVPVISGVRFHPVAGFPAYAVGDNGTVWSLWVRRGCGRGNIAVIGSDWRQLGFQRLSKGYLGVTLCANGIRKQVTVHRLVLDAFVGPCPEGMQCCHFPDPSPSNNMLSNLRWGTPIDNMIDRDAHGRTMRGHRNGNAKLTQGNVQKARDMLSNGHSRSATAKHFNVSYSAIFLLDKGRTHALS